MTRVIEEQPRIGTRMVFVSRTVATALALGVSLMAGSLLAAPATQASLQASSQVADLPGTVDGVAVGATGTVYATLPDQDAIAVVSFASQPQVRIIDLPGTANPLGIAVTADEKTAYVGRLPDDANPDGRLDRVDLVTGAVTQIEGVGYWPNDIELTADDRTLVVAVAGQAEVVLIDTATNSVRDRVRLRESAGVVAIRGNIAFAGSSPAIYAIDIPTGSVRTSSTQFAGEVVSMTVMGDELIAAIRLGPEQLPRLTAFDVRTLQATRSLEIPPNQPEFASSFEIASSFTRIYATWGLGWDIDGESFPVVTVPSSRTGFGTIRPYETGLEFVGALGTDSLGRWLAVAGFSFSRGTFVMQRYATDDQLRSVTAQARLSGPRLTITGSTTGINAGTRVRVFVRQGKKFVAQKKLANVRANGTFTWRQAVRGNPTRAYVVVDGLRSATITVRR
jgi:hypothetical protein